MKILKKLEKKTEDDKGILKDFREVTEIFSRVSQEILKPTRVSRKVFSRVSQEILKPTRVSRKVFTRVSQEILNSRFGTSVPQQPAHRLKYEKQIWPP